jgi:hypothetical protein
MREIGQEVDNSIVLLIFNPIFKVKTKHVEIDFYFVKENVENDNIKVQYISSKDQLVYIFTKPLASVIYSYFLNTKLFIFPNQ